MPNPYPDRFMELFSEVMMRGQHLPMPVVLDLGSGGRSHLGLVSMDYTEHPDNSLRGDCLALPFRDASVDLILSQAVIEHVTSPEQAFSEMFRVLRPGGLLYVEIAFMQPVHQEPHHYFNVTPYGLTLLLSGWETLERGTTGTFQEVIDWLYKAVGVSPPETIRGIRRELYELAASGVSALARKPYSSQ